MPREVYGQAFRFLPHDQLLTFEEITRLARLAISLGVRKIRLTGGEPLLRRDVERLVGMLAALDGQVDLTLTTNGSLLAEKAAALADAGLQRVTVSLDSLDDDVFSRLNDVRFPVARVLEGLAAAERAGLAPIKVNMVVRRGVNEDSILPMARFARERGYTLRYIEYMDVGHTNGWDLDEVVPASEILERVAACCPLSPSRRTIPARSRRAGAISTARARSASSPRSRNPSVVPARVPDSPRRACCSPASSASAAATSAGRSRRGDDDEAMRALLATAWERRTDRYSEVRSEATEALPRVEMSRIGG